MARRLPLARVLGPRNGVGMSVSKGGRSEAAVMDAASGLTI
ncbi:hypothetical protein APY04_1437 [Hyphomicrobium sulfonivorans]|uniref:Uncharacterized protein n=1 Tax=Hyphomicrobium sulfonivorans TaxID=121290 RepID=A0A109BIN4_HYPSL|nr:hypothetical protein APY04_1437 [Hyphomicrobium sulfonivorans]